MCFWRNVLRSMGTKQLTNNTVMKQYNEKSQEVYYLVNPYKGTKKRIPPNGTRVNVRTSPKIGRNELCPCGSGKKYKKCCQIDK